MSGDPYCLVHGQLRCRCVERLNASIRDHRFDIVPIEEIAQRMGMGVVEYGPGKPPLPDGYDLGPIIDEWTI